MSKPADKPEDKRFCRICQHCPHTKVEPVDDKDASLAEKLAIVEANLVRAASGAILADDRPKDGNPPFMAGVFALLSHLTVTISGLTKKLESIPEDTEEAKTTAMTLAGLKGASERINNHVIRYLYETIPHPVDTLLGERFRRADGSGNNVHIPSMGQAGTSYARTCRGKRLPMPKLPEPADIFDKLLKAPEGKERDPHPAGSSSLTFAFASLVTHSLFRTDPSDWNKNLTSSYLDLSPLYGSNQQEQDAVRIKNGLGLLHPDTFSESRIVFLPPAAGCLLVMFNRNHNCIAETILKNNEQGRWKRSPPEDIGQRTQQDEEIFQTARLINCAAFMSVVLNDYVAGFIGTTRSEGGWSMAPFDDFRDTNHQPVGRGEGNHVSVEFDILYRWHSVVSTKEEDWTLNIIQSLFPNKKVGDLKKEDFFGALGRLRSGAVPDTLIVHPDPSKRNFGGIKRGTDGRFKDEDLAGVLQKATRDPAHRYGGRGTPEVLKVIEIVGMEQARRWGVCTMNEFRVRMGLIPFRSFEHWAGEGNQEIADAAKELYGNIDDLELYPGLHAEEPMKLGPGSGLCAGYTTTRGILSDAIALVRGDRFFTTDFTPANLTSWGMEDVQKRHPKGFGAYLPLLLQRALPDHYPNDSAYTWFPFFTPATAKANLARLEKDQDYKYDFPTPSVDDEAKSAGKA